MIARFIRAVCCWRRKPVAKYEIGGPKIAVDAVTADKISGNAVTSAKIATNKVYCQFCSFLVLTRRSEYECHAESNRVCFPKKNSWLNPDMEPLNKTDWR